MNKKGEKEVEVIKRNEKTTCWQKSIMTENILENIMKQCSGYIIYLMKKQAKKNHKVINKISRNVTDSERECFQKGKNDSPISNKHVVT